ncbi:MAG TPA: TonB-dependent receptor [Candidatus Coprenecus stercoravium]|uniref:TonB-dependent receptor n=1 Tax=Candidatus Coprenecus stercoravium TaxID=2840735 RepID=A0A9D2KA84_9BACT|nr:TonB-dependent receptor [Candidatus Coprenecus stercoravium]
MNRRFLKAVLFLIVIFSFLHTGKLSAQTLKGVVKDAETDEPLAGVVIMFERVADDPDAGMTGTQTEADGSYTLKVPEGAEGVLGLYLIGYNDLKSEPFRMKRGESKVMDFAMQLQSEVLESVVVVARKNPESVGALINDRKVSAQAVENIGAVELRTKGLSNVAEAVETMSGVSFNNSGQLFVRGLGDRYSLTTLNGLPVASPNPDNKLIPLDIFSSSVLQNITVTKVYTATSFADYSGAHIDIATKENVGDSFLSVSLGLNSIIGTTFKDTYRPDRKGWLLQDNNIPRNVRNMSLPDFRTYIVDNDPFGTSFDIKKSMALPDISGSVSGGRTFKLRNGDELSLLGSASISSGSQSIYDAYITNINTQGQHMDEFHYNGYEHSLDLTGLLSLNYLFKNGDKIGFTMLYAKNAMEDYKLREGYDAEDNQLLGSNSIAHSYSLWNNQLGGSHALHPSWNLDWKVSYGMTDSNEPDRRQVMYRKGGDGSLSLFKLNRQETMRYYGELAEQELVAEIKPTFSFGEKSKLIFGAAYKDKTRDYNSIRFYYNLNDINPSITDIYTPSSFLNQQSITDGLIKIERDAQPKNNYYAGHRILAGFAEVEYYPLDQLLLSLGVRYEYSEQWVQYWNDASRESISRLNKGDFFPALNIKYTLNNRHNFRFASSITVTRPSFIEMAPFLYKESYGSAEIRGNDQLLNGYNYNFDLKYEYFSTNNKHMFSVGAYYKILKDPIERVQETSGGAIVHTFRNAEQGMAAGLEAEFRTTPFRYFTIGGNVSLMYTDVTLLDGGIYTDSRRALQGASPYIGNAFITYAPEFNEESSLAVSVLYNVQGPRIQAVGIYGLGNIMQAPIHTLDANITYQINRLWSVELSLTNLLDSEFRFTQNVPDLGEDMLTESYRLGRGIGVGVKFDF